MPVTQPEFPEWLKWILVTFGTAIIVRFSKLIEWIGNFLRFKKKDAVDVKKAEQDIVSSQVESANSIVKTAADYTTIVMANLDKAEKRLSELSEESMRKDLVIASLRSHVNDVNHENIEVKKELEGFKNVLAESKRQIQNLLDELAECLKISDCSESLKKIKEKFGIEQHKKTDNGELN